MASLPLPSLEAFLSHTDAVRGQRVIAKLTRHSLQGWVLAGSFALEAHKVRLELQGLRRPLHDIDFVVDTFDRIPDTLASDFAFRHIHPYDPPAKTLLQAVDMQNALRVDVFRTHTSVVERSHPFTLSSSKMRLLSLEDIVARLARLSWNLVLETPVGAKYVRDLLAAHPFGDRSGLDAAWQDHRTPTMPEVFGDALAIIESMAQSHPELLITPVYSTDPTQTCDRCHETASFRLADAGVVLSVLGYC